MPESGPRHPRREPEDPFALLAALDRPDVEARVGEAIRRRAQAELARRAPSAPPTRVGRALAALEPALAGVLLLVDLAATLADIRGIQLAGAARAQLAALRAWVETFLA